MANSYYTAFVKGLLNAEYDLDTASVKAALVRGYTYSASHATMADVVGGGGGTINGASAALASPSVTGGVFDATDTTIPTTANATDHVVVIYQSSAVTGGSDVAQSSQKLICMIDTGTNLPVQPGTGNVAVTFDNGTSKILKVG